LKETNFNKENISKILSKKKGFPLSISKKLVNDLINIFIIHLKSRSLIIKNIGSFKIIFKKERYGRNPKTGKSHIISSRKVVKFTSSKKILREINE